MGRSERQGYAYILFSQDKVLKETAISRLRAIQAYVSLGSGYDLAMKDLQIRGAGTLLGEKQSGHVTAVGFELYCKLLQETVSKKQKSNYSKKTTYFIESSSQNLYS